jgi:electron transfer flavoprotein beta subunit
MEWRMKIVVAVKQVPERDAPVRVAADGRGVDERDVAWTMNEPDAYALEEALQLKERDGEGEVVVLCAGPERVQSTLREALAKGADRAVHVVTPEVGEGSLASRDSLDVARLLADAVKAEAADLVLTGLQSDDLGAGQTGVVMAELLGVPHATLVLQVELVGGGIKVKRELPAGAASKRVDEVVKVSPPTRVKRTEMLTGSADEIAATLVERLRFEVKVL